MKPVPHVDVYSILLYIAGLGGITGAIAIDQDNHTIKVVIAILGALSFAAGLAARTFYNPTPTQQAIVQDQSSNLPVEVDVHKP